MKILLLTKTTPWCHLVQEVMRKSGHEVTIVQGTSETSSKVGNKLIKMTSPGPFDLIISYICPWILDKSVLATAPRAINFHPGPPNHPGFAPYSWAIRFLMDHVRYNDTPLYGVTAHYMKTKVDTGLIVRTKYFEMRSDDTVVRLQHRTMRHLFALFMGLYQEGFPHLVDNDFWKIPPRTRADFEAMRLIDPELDSEDIDQVIRACRYPGQPGAYFEGEVG